MKKLFTSLLLLCLAIVAQADVNFRLLGNELSFSSDVPVYFDSSSYNGIKKGKITWNAFNNTLTLDNVEVEIPWSQPFLKIYDHDENITVKLIGDNKITCTNTSDQHPYGQAFYFHGENVTFTSDGTGSLTLDKCRLEVYASTKVNENVELEFQNSTFNLYEVHACMTSGDEKGYGADVIFKNSTLNVENYFAAKSVTFTNTVLASDVRFDSNQHCFVSSSTGQPSGFATEVIESLESRNYLTTKNVAFVYAGDEALVPIYIVSNEITIKYQFKLTLPSGSQLIDIRNKVGSMPKTETQSDGTILVSNPDVFINAPESMLLMVLRLKVPLLERGKQSSNFSVKISDINLWLSNQSAGEKSSPADITSQIHVGQAVSPGSWTAGRDITNFRMHDADFSAIDHMQWTLEGEQEGSATLGFNNGMFNAWNQTAPVKLYQDVELPAGKYQLNIQGYYQYGSYFANDPNTFGTENWKDIANLFIQKGMKNSAGEFVAADEVELTPVMPRLFPRSTTAYFTKEKYPDAGTNMYDGQYTVDGQSVWAPTSTIGAPYWFEANQYNDVDDSNNRYNTIPFTLSKSMTVRVGLDKAQGVDEEDLIINKFQLIYQGAVSEDEIIADSKAKLADYTSQLKALANEHPGFLASKINALISEVARDQRFTSNPTASDYQSWVETTWTGLQNALETVPRLDALQTALDFAYRARKAKVSNSAYGKYVTALTDLIDEAESVYDDNFTYSSQAWDYPVTLAASLKQAANIYLGLSDTVVYYGKDFSGFISSAWFSNPEYEPTYDAKEHTWQSNEAVMATPWAGVASASRTDLGNATYPPLADKVQFVHGSTDSSADLSYVWTAHSAIEDQPFYLGWREGLTCVEINNLGGKDEISSVSIRLDDLPSGYYAARALVNACKDDEAENPPYISMNNGKSTCSPYAVVTKNADDNWNEVETGLILVDDEHPYIQLAGKAKGSAAFTGFQLYYYGNDNEINFDLLIRTKIPNSESLIWAGDKRIVKGMIDDLYKINDWNLVTYNYAVENLIPELNNYIREAMEMQEAFPTEDWFTDYTTDRTLVQPAIDYVNNFGKDEKDTYKVAEQVNFRWNRYAAFFKTVKKLGDGIGPQASAVLDKVYPKLRDHFATFDEMQGYIDDLNEAIMEDATTFSIDDIVATPGSTITVPINLTNPAELCYVLLSLEQIKDVLAIESITVTDRAKNSTFSSGTSNNTVTAVVFDANDTPIEGSEGTLFYATMKIADNAAPGDYNLKLTTEMFRTTSGSLFSNPEQTFKVKIQNSNPGDANGDGSVTITDALAVVYKVLNKSVEGFVEANADMDGSGDITITDALAIVKKVLGNSSSASAKERVVDEAEQLDPQ